MTDPQAARPETDLRAESAADATPEIEYWTPKVRAYSDEELLIFFDFRTRDLAASCHDMPVGHLHAMTTTEISYMRRELERRLARPDALREKVMARIEALPTYVWDNTDDDDTEYVSLASVNSAVAAALEAER